MTESDNNIQTLLDEFTNITVDIQVKETYSDDIYNPITEKDEESGQDIIIGFPKLWDFILTFNRDFTIESHSIKYLNQNAILEYTRFIEEKKSNAYQELDDFIVSENSLFEKMNYLSSIRLRFKEQLKNYYYISDDNRDPLYKLLVNEILIRSISDEKHVNSVFEKKLVNSFLVVQRKAIKALVKYLNGKLQSLHYNVDPKFQKDDIVENENKKDVKRSKEKRIFTTRSFELNKIIDVEEKLKSFNEELEKNSLIEPIDFRLFKHAFTNEEVLIPIKWISEPNELYYLIKKLYDKNIIKRFKNYWQITCKCFELHDGSGRSFTASYLQRCHEPELGNRLRILNSAVSTLE